MAQNAHTFSKTIQFIRRGEIVSLSNVPPTRTLLEVLREDLGCTGTKEGCGEGDCGACTVVLGEAHEDGIKYRAINSCIRMAHSVDGLALWTVEDLTSDPLLQTQAAGTAKVQAATLHPAQESLVQCHGSQCGFCTPGFVMSLFGMYQQHVAHGTPITRELAQRDLSGNLCRCTGYRPILDAAQEMTKYPAVTVDEAALLSKLSEISTGARTQADGGAGDTAYWLPETLQALLQTRADNPAAQVVAGCTDVGLWVTKMHMDFKQVLDVTRVAELRRIEHREGTLVIGAAVPLEDAFAALVKVWPQLHTFAARFAGLPVRNSGTLGGNVANGSPIGDSMPLLIALRARIGLMSLRGERTMPLEDFYTGYRKNLLAADEVVAFITIPLPEENEAERFLRVYKISKRYDDDISTVCLAIDLTLENGVVKAMSIGAGGVAATPVRAVRTEEALRGQVWSAGQVKAAMAALRSEFEPISDMRASANYRREVLGNLLQRFWLESQGQQQINLESLSMETLA